MSIYRVTNCLMSLFILLAWERESCSGKTFLTCYIAGVVPSLPPGIPFCNRVSGSVFSIALLEVNYGYMKSGTTCSQSTYDNFTFSNRCEQPIMGSDLAVYTNIIGRSQPTLIWKAPPPFPASSLRPSCDFSASEPRYTVLKYECKHGGQTKSLNQLCSWSDTVSEELLIGNDHFPDKEIQTSVTHCFCTITALNSTILDLRTYYADLRIGQSLKLALFNGSTIKEWTNNGARFPDNVLLPESVSTESLRLTWMAPLAGGKLWIGIKAVSTKLDLTCQYATSTIPTATTVSTVTSTTPRTATATSSVTVPGSAGVHILHASRNAVSVSSRSDVSTTSAKRVPVSNGTAFSPRKSSGNVTVPTATKDSTLSGVAVIGICVGVPIGVYLVIGIITIACVYYKKRNRITRVQVLPPTTAFQY